MSLPVFLRLEGRDVLLVGGGRVAAAKLGALRQAGARVRVVAPAVCDEIAAAGVAVHRRPFAAADLDGVWFVVAAATPAVNRAVEAAAASRHLFVNSTDDAATASAFFGSTLRRGGVTLAISTDGAAPALGRLLREALEVLLPPAADLRRWVTAARRLRADWRAHGVPVAARRRRLLDALVRLEHTRAGACPAAAQPAAASRPGTPVC